MAARKTKKIVTPEKNVEVPVNFASPLTGYFVAAPSDGCTDAPYEQQPADTDMQKRVQDEIDNLYPRTRLGTEGILDAVLRELIRARLSR